MEASLRQSIAEELDVDPSVLTPECELSSLENWDSVMALTLMVLLGEAAGAPIDPAAISKAKTIGDLSALVAKAAKSAE